jgi:hypothetical protein
MLAAGSGGSFGDDRRFLSDLFSSLTGKGSVG